MLKRLVAHVIILTCLIGFMPQARIYAEDANVVVPKKNSNVKNPIIQAKGAILMDMESGTVLYKKRENIKIPVASLTKIMTAVVVLENYKLNQVVKVTSRAATQIPTKMWLKKNEKITVENLLYGLLMNSANDAAFAFTPLASPTNTKKVMPFINLMNKKAKDMGLKNTSFKDPAGLNSGSKSSAYDLAKLTSYAFKNPKFAQIVKTTKKTVYSTNKKTKHFLKNTNKLIHPKEKMYMPTAIGVKTGYTDPAGPCLLGAVNYNGHILISVILHSERPVSLESTRLSKRLLKWGMNSYTW